MNFYSHFIVMVIGGLSMTIFINEAKGQQFKLR
jgi:hypothetical protein